MNRITFLSLRVYWKDSLGESLNPEELGISSRHHELVEKKKKKKKHLKNCSEFRKYIKDVRDSRDRKTHLRDFPNLGLFTLVRHFQLQISDRNPQ